MARGSYRKGHSKKVRRIKHTNDRKDKEKEAKIVHPIWPKLIPSDSSHGESERHFNQGTQIFSKKACLSCKISVRHSFIIIQDSMAFSR